jgi:hypothetical protein
LLNEVIELASVYLSQPIEAATADNLFLEALLQTGSFLVPDEDVDAIDTTQRKQHFFKQNFA